MATMKEVTELGNRIDELNNLALMLADAIDQCTEYKSMAQLARQYRETLKELEGIGMVKDDDEIADILQCRTDNGLPGRIRKNIT